HLVVGHLQRQEGEEQRQEQEHPRGLVSHEQGELCAGQAQDLLERADGRTSPGGNDRGRTHGVLSSESLRSGAGIAWCSPTDRGGRTIGDLEEHLLQGCAANLKVAQDRVVLGGPGKKYRDHAVSTL